MAIDNTQKALNIARSLRDESQNLMRAYRRLIAIKDAKESSGIDLLDYNTDYAAWDDLKHLDGTVLNNVLSSSALLSAFLIDNFHDDNFEQASLNP